MARAHSHHADYSAAYADLLGALQALRVPLEDRTSDENDFETWPLKVSPKKLISHGRIANLVLRIPKYEDETYGPSLELVVYEDEDESRVFTCEVDYDREYGWKVEPELGEGYTDCPSEFRQLMDDAAREGITSVEKALLFARRIVDLFQSL